MNIDGIVKTITVTNAITIMEKWSLEYKYSDETNKLKKCKGIQNIINWVEYTSEDKDIYSAIVNDKYMMLTFVEKKKNNLKVNGFLGSPFINSETYNAARSIITLNLVDYAYKSNKNILFAFHQ